jgi:hypothetical protein
MALQGDFQRNGTVFSVSNALKCSLCEIDIFEILDMLQDGFTDEEAFRASGAPG